MPGVWKPSGHACLLRKEDIVTQAIDNGPLIHFRRKLRRLTMINKKHPKTKQEFRSYSAIRCEEVRHVLKYYNMIHPFSIAVFYRSIVMIFVYIILFFCIPMHLAFPVSDKIFFRVIFIMNCIHLVDIILNFFTGYLDKENRIVMNPTLVARQYLKTYFFFDFVSSLPSYFYLLKFHEMNNSWIMFFFGNVMFLKIARLGCLLRSMDEWRKYVRFSKHFFKTTAMFLIFVLSIFWATGLVHAFFHAKRVFTQGIMEDFFFDVLESLHWFIIQLLLVGYGQNDFVLNISPLDTMATVVLFCCGFILQLYLLAKIHQVWYLNCTAGNKHTFILGQIREYADYKMLPVEMRNDLMNYFDYKFHKQFYKENEINKIVSYSLTREIRMDAAKAHIENVQMFMDLPRNIQLDVAVKLKSRIYMPGDVIVKAGEPGYSMFFIFTGTVAVYSRKGNEMCHLEDGDHFGDVGLLFNETRLATVVAVTPCELFKLNKVDFMKIMETHETILEKIVETATKKYLIFAKEEERNPLDF